MPWTSRTCYDPANGRLRAKRVGHSGIETHDLNLLPANERNEMYLHDDMCSDKLFERYMCRACLLDCLATPVRVECGMSGACKRGKTTEIKHQQERSHLWKDATSYSDDQAFAYGGVRAYAPGYPPKENQERYQDARCTAVRIQARMN